MLTALRALLTTEPVRVAALVAAVLVFAAAKVGVVIDEQDIAEALVLIVPILLGGEAARSRVSPARPADVTPSDEMLAERLERDVEET